MKFWLFIITALVVQELALESASLVQAHQYVPHLWIVHIVFLIGTLFDVWIGYRLGKLAQARLGSSKLEQFVKRRVATLEKVMGQRGEKFALVVLGFISFAHVDAFVFSWTDIPFRTILLYVTIGDLLQYALLWAVIVGTVTVTSSYWIVLVAAVAISTGIIILVERTQVE